VDQSKVSFPMTSHEYVYRCQQRWLIGIFDQCRERTGRQFSWIWPFRILWNKISL